MKYELKVKQKGAILLEILVAVAAAALIVGLGAQLVYVSLRSNKVSTERNTSLGLAEEGIEGIKAASFEKWANIYSLNKNQPYHPEVATDHWVVAPGEEVVVLNEIMYTRSVQVQNVCRDSANRNITGITDTDGTTTTCIASGGGHDPSTQKIIASITWPNADPFTASEYVTRWPNKVCGQTAWSSIGTGPVTCPSPVYDSQTNITVGNTLELCEGGC